MSRKTRVPMVRSITCEACGREWCATKGHWGCPWCGHDSRRFSGGRGSYGLPKRGYRSRPAAMQSVGRKPK